MILSVWNPKCLLDLDWNFFSYLWHFTYSSKNMDCAFGTIFFFRAYKQNFLLSQCHPYLAVPTGAFLCLCWWLFLPPCPHSPSLDPFYCWHFLQSFVPSISDWLSSVLPSLYWTPLSSLLHFIDVFVFSASSLCSPLISFNTLITSSVWDCIWLCLSWCLYCRISAFFFWRVTLSWFFVFLVLLCWDLHILCSFFDLLMSFKQLYSFKILAMFMWGLDIVDSRR